METVRISHAEWTKVAEERYGPNAHDWRFVCPSCRTVVTVREYKEAGAPEGAVAFSCLGRFTPVKRRAFEGGEGPCDYAGGGLICINPVTVVVSADKEIQAFDFADDPLAEAVTVG